MSATREALHAIRTVARQLGELRERVVFVGGVVRGLLITDPAVEGSRTTRDVDVIAAGITTRADYYANLHPRLRALGFVEDTSEGAPLCRWKAGPAGSVTVDVMPPAGDVLGFTNRWYPHAIDTATTVHLDDDGEGSVAIRLVSAPAFIATKLEAFAGRGGGDYVLSHDLEDIIAVVDGRPELLAEIEREPDALRSYIAAELKKHFAAGLIDAAPGHLAGDEASQARLPFVLCTLDRLRRLPRVVRVGDVVRSMSGVDPGEAHPGPWQYEILGAERRRVSTTRDHIVVRARLVNLGHIAGTVGDGSEMQLEDARGVRVPPLEKLTARERERRKFPEAYARALPNEAFETCWVYELAMEARSLRLLLPGAAYEFPMLAEYGSASS